MDTEHTLGEDDTKKRIKALLNKEPDTQLKNDEVMRRRVTEEQVEKGEEDRDNLLGQ
jgi:hypothetical protein